MSGSDLRLVLVGWGAIATRVSALLAQHGTPVRIVAVGLRNAYAHRDGLPKGTRLISDPAELGTIDADLLIEAAGRDSVSPWARAGLARGWDVAISSTSALTDAALLVDLTQRARQARSQILIPPGALGGIDALSAASRLGLQSVRHEVVKPARAWAGTQAESLCDLSALTAPFTFFEGSARAAAAAYPQNANVAVISALAGIGLDRTTVALTADPCAKLNSHRITAIGDFGTLTLLLENSPLATNPKSSEMTALSLVRMIENRAGTLVI
ncbi:aspartate dehydrogenase [Pseudorhodobacter ferrugineus]|uniref:aspartate dehydrogenase n=1 Tax=Pseudorhodobacter ferrugineus TaxID=77008 RepID=UPI0003B5DFE9|nr:aspartate dehydrogenase [Pseudorhodobacter ferrugineus]